MAPDFLSVPGASHIFPLTGGANNQVFKIEFSNRPPLVCKHYFQNPNDLRPRLQSEFSFLKYAWAEGIRNIPEPLQADPISNQALYSFLPGTAIQPGSVTPSLIDQTLSFFTALNRNKSSATALCPASESCFSIADYLRITQERIHRLERAAKLPSASEELALFLQKELLPKWRRLRELACKTALHDLSSPISSEDRCISPSDFGFHNALIDDAGKISFLDFEYAGWDDPCKTLSDFFCQPKIAVPEIFFSRVKESFFSFSPHPDLCEKRFRIVWPVMQIKWCCILLNSFTRVGKTRRIFSHSEEIDQMERQLKMAKHQLKKIET